MRSAIFLAGCLAVLMFDARSAGAANVTGGGSGSSIATPVSVANGGTAATTGGITTAKLSGAPTMGASSTSCPGGVLTHGTTYHYKVMALGVANDNTKGTLPSAAADQATGACGNADTSTITINWTAVANAAGYAILGRTDTTHFVDYAAAGATSYVDTGSIAQVVGPATAADHSADETHVGQVTINGTLTGSAPLIGDLGGTLSAPTVLSVADVTTGTLKAANGGTSDATTGWSSAARPASPDSRNDEFDGTAYSGWTTTIGSCAQSGTAIDPLAAFNTVNVYRHSWNSYWPGWLAIQSTANNQVCGIAKAVTINTNDLWWTRTRVVMPSSGFVVQGATAEICIISDLSSTHYVCAQTYNDNGTPTLKILSDGAGSTAITGSNTFVHTTGADIIGLQKVGTTYYALYGTLGQLTYSASLVNANAMADIGLEVYNGTGATFVPGNPIIGFDYIRAINSATATPW